MTRGRCVHLFGSHISLTVSPTFWFEFLPFLGPIGHASVNDRAIATRDVTMLRRSLSSTVRRYSHHRPHPREWSSRASKEEAKVIAIPLSQEDGWRNHHSPSNSSFPEQSSSSPAFVVPLDWLWQQVKVPKGFENFFPKGGQNVVPKKKKEDGTSKESKGGGKDDNTPPNETKQKKDPFGAFRGGGGGSSGGNNNKNNNNNNNEEQPQPPQNVGALAALLLLVIAARSALDDEASGNGREVTWTDFRNFMLEPDEVERIVVVNKKYARVILRPGARGVPLERFQNSRSPMSSSSSSSSNSRGMHSTTPQSSDWNDGTVLDMGSSSSASESAAASNDWNPMSSGNKDSASSSSSSSNQLVYHFHIGSVESFEEKLARSQHDLGIHPRDYVPVQYVNETNWTLELLKVAPTLVMGGALLYFLRGAMGGAAGAGGGGGMGGIFKIGKSNAKKISKEDVNVSFKDVAGCQEAKKEIMEFVDFLQDSTRFAKLGAKIPKGAILTGPPGTGKTLLAKAVAGEASVPFYSISGSDFIEMFVGVGPSRVRDLFKEARANAPCIVFIDEIDAVGRQRGKGGFSGGNDERENTLNQLLVEMDGFTPTTGVVVLAGTNRVDILDQALTRPGRFDRQVQVDKPDLQGRKEIFQVHLQGITLEGEIDDYAGRLAGLTPGFAGADIANICNEAAIVAARRKAESVTIDDFEKATDRVIGGLESNKIMSKEERSIVAHHEAGHAVAGWFLEHADPLLKVTIIPRSSGALGYAQYLPKEVFLRTEEQIMDIVCMALAGRAAEEIFFGKVTTGASDDLRRVTDLVYSTIQVYGMNDRVGQLAFPKDPNAAPGDKPYSDATAEAMDEEARAIVDAAYERTLNLMKEKKTELEKVALCLLDKETITHDDIVDLIGARPFQGDDAYNEYVSRRQMMEKKEDPSLPKEEEEAKEEEEGLSGGTGGLTPGLAFTSYNKNNRSVQHHRWTNE